MKPSRLRPDPEKVRAWQRRSQERARQRERERQDRMARGEEPRPKRRRKVTIPKPIRHEVRERSRGICVVCLLRTPEALTATDAALRLLIRRGTIGGAVQLHHVLPEAKYPHLAKHADNLVGICPDDHYRHEFTPNGRIPRAALPDCALQLAAREGADSYIERTYPA